MTRSIRIICGAASVLAALLVAACGGADSALTEVHRVQSGDLDIVLLSEDGALNQGKEAFVMEFRKGGSLVDAGTVTTSANMSMPGMTMPAGIQVERTDVVGRYRATGNFGMAGAWQMKVDWNGPAGQGSASFDGPVQ